MSAQELSAHIAHIKQSLASATACTSAITEALTSILTPDPLIKPQKSNANTLSQKKNARLPVARGARGVAARSKKKPEVAVLEIHEPGEERLNPAERLKLAAEVVNITLKRLTEVLQATVVQKPSRGSLLSRKSSKHQSQGGLISTSLAPLQPRCVNRANPSVSESSCSRRSSCATQTEHGPSILVVAECARIAFAALRALESLGGTISQMPRLQLEEGMSVLIGKLIALGIEEMAIKELRILTKRISMKVEEGEALVKRTLADLLYISHIPSDPQVVSLIVTTQLQTLKLLAVKKEGCNLETVYKYIRLSSPCSPAKLLDQLTSIPSPQFRQKALRQMETLAQLLLAICTSGSSEIGRSLTVDVVLQYQILALQLRGRWWNLAGHKVDTEKQVIKPLVNYFDAFIRRTTNADQKIFDIVESTLDSLSEIFGTLRVPTILQTLSDLAQKCKNFGEALHYSGLLLAALKNSDASKARICGVLCQLAKLRLQSGSLNDVKTNEVSLVMLRSAAEALQGSLTGDSSELDEVLIQVANLRKASLVILYSAHQFPAFQKICLKVVLLGPKFLIRYIGERPVLMGTRNIEERFLKRLELACQILRPTVEDVASLSKLSLADDANIWSTIDSALQDCAGLLSNIETWDGLDKTLLRSSSHRNSSLFTLLSNAYWCHYLRQKSRCTDLGELQSCLQRSIELISERPLVEKHAAFLPAKLEKLAGLYEQRKKPEEAKAMFFKALKLQLEVGSLRIASEYASSKPLSQVFNGDSGVSMLARLLECYVVLTCRAASGKQGLQYFDDDQLSVSERGILLEYQLMLLSNAALFPNIHVSESALRKISVTLLELYDDKRFPIRKLRLVVRILQIQASWHTTFEPDFIVNILAMQTPSDILSLGNDTGLKRYTTHLQACREVAVVMFQNPPCPKTLEVPLRTWSKLLGGGTEETVLQDQIDDTNDWLHSLEDIAEYLHMQGCERQRVSVLQLSTTARGFLCTDPDPAYISDLIALSLQYTRLGYLGKGGEVLQKTWKYVSSMKSSLHMTIRWHIAYSEYLVKIGNFAMSEEHIQKSRELLVNMANASEAERSHFHDRLSKLRTNADLAHVLFLLSEARGHFQTALYHARKSVRFSQRLWALLERRSRLVGLEADRVDQDSPAISTLEAAGIPVILKTQASLQPAAFWSLVPELIRRLGYLSKMFSHCGLYPEARYYADQAMKIANSVGSSVFKSQINVLIGDYEVRRGKFDDGLFQIMKGIENIGEQGAPGPGILAQLALANAFAKTGDSQAEGEALTNARSLAIQRTSTASMEEIPHSPDLLEGVNLQMQNLSILPPPSRTQRNKSRVPAASTKTKQHQKKPQNHADIKSSVNVLVIEQQPLLSLRAHVMREVARSALRKGDLEVSSACLLEAGLIPAIPLDMVDQALALAQLALKEGLYYASDDPMFSVLPDSTTSCPSVDHTGRRRSKDYLSAIQLQEPGRKAKKSRSQLTPKAGEPTGAKSGQLNEYLQKALAAIHTIPDNAQSIISNSRLHFISSLLFKIVMMLSTTCTTMSSIKVSPIYGLYAMELGRSVATIKESSVIHIDKLLATDKGTDEFLFEAKESLDHLVDPQINIAAFQAAYIDIIPISWKVITISLSEDFKELRLARLRTAQTPFMLAIPLDRHCSRDGEDQIFGFEEGKSELLKIIELANHSTHDAGIRDMSKKGAKTEWWEARATLDTRLKDLLNNMETIWLGGFRGIFAQQSPHHELLARFKRSFSIILDKHLPSRRMACTTAASGRTVIDSQVLELFIDLGNPAEVGDLDECLMDLLYFVVDILQFSGERNAYDEVDFDSISVETLDALSHYHEAVREIPEDVDMHTILILDKALHCFPWESLPCMSSHPVSRLPSLSHLRHRIIEQTRQFSQSERLTTDGYHVDSNDGAYILNPAGDLHSTQEIFQKPLATLANWSATINRTPSEEAIAASLSSRSIFLYFGHGSGSQYISSRAIRKLDRCAVALLMGCSSGIMVEEGEFESHGIPMTYLHAGAQAVVGTLWDVTDKDIDRFSISVLKKWGLFEQNSEFRGRSPAKKGVKGKGRARAGVTAMRNGNNEPPQKGTVSLDQAVARGREACFLKYLNGAAPVMYGTPVFLS